MSTLNLRTLEVGDNLSGKKLYFDIPADLELPTQEFLTCLGGSMSIMSENMGSYGFDNTWYMYIDSYDYLINPPYSEVRIITVDNGVLSNKIDSFTMPVEENIFSIASINKTHPAYQYIKIEDGQIESKINPAQDYDIIQTLTFAEASGTCNIRLYRGSSITYTGTVKVREGTSGAWSDLSVSGTTTTFNVTNTTMQIAHDWNKSGNDYMTCSFYNQTTNLTGISISQKAALSGIIGNYFMYQYARGCTVLTSLDVPNTSGITTIDTYFMYGYSRDCTNLTSLGVPDTSSITTVGDYFMNYYANGCTNLTSLGVPDTSSIISVSDNFMYYYAAGCTNLTSLDVPDTSSITGSVGNYFMAHYASWCSNLTSLGAQDTSSIISVGDSFMYFYSFDCSKLTSLGVPDTSSITTVGDYFMNYYAGNCNALTTLILPSVGWFATHDVDWSVSSSRLTYLKGQVLNSSDAAGWQALTTSTSPNTLYLNYIRSDEDVLIPPDFYIEYETLADGKTTVQVDTGAELSTFIMNNKETFINHCKVVAKLPEITSCWGLFSYCTATTLDLSNFDTANVIDMSYMFDGSQALTIDLSNFNTSSVTNMTGMFADSPATSLDLSSFDTSNVTNMSGMFYGSQATSLDLSSFDTSSVTDMSYMFFYSQATSLDLSSFDTSSVTSMSSMFLGSQATTGYARTQADADRFNSSSDKPTGLIFIVKPTQIGKVLFNTNEFKKIMFEGVEYKKTVYEDVVLWSKDG